MPSTWRDQFRGSGDWRAWGARGARGRGAGGGFGGLLVPVLRAAELRDARAQPHERDEDDHDGDEDDDEPLERQAEDARGGLVEVVVLQAVGANVDVGAGVGGTDGAPVGTGDTDGGGETVGATEHVCGTPGAAPSQHTVQVGSASVPSSSTQTGSRQPSSPKDQW